MVTEDRHFYIYCQSMGKAMEDGVISIDESNLLELVADHFGFKKSEKDIARHHVMGSEKLEWSDDQIAEFVTDGDSDDHALYTKIIVEALMDDMITKEEWAIINHLRHLFAISDDEHKEIESTVQTEIDRRRDEMRYTFNSYLETYFGRQFTQQFE